ncbi:AAA family ATPase [Brachyspira hyodysenteriae]|nr:ATP-binding protein [Brachyspira hyodysenteriae]MBT8719890.1 AAA family ATPase [Brachyspira hyodysenteriae]MBT8730129.1 AAA family ATPase [Brachyspira hyodysenteriae]MBT8732551.1 AAA family ATPase [Brachyspira hyodysenteriae]MBT8735324.1 AAA family ATPase [Brachyspira hyodysenteriae]MBT8737965.1 AAA family ATPase [Brachyspira hyodysenteriae]
MQKIIIRNLLVVKDFEMEINKFNLIIGEQSSGKSTISKAIFFFKDINNYMKFLIYTLTNNINYNIIKLYNDSIKTFFIKNFDKLENIDDNLYLKYKYKQNTYIEIIKKNNDLNINYSENIVIFFKQLDKYIKKYYGEYSIDNKNIKMMINFEKNIGIKIDNFFENILSTYYIPASRSSIALLNNQKTRLNYEIMDFINSSYMQTTEALQSLFNNGINTLLSKLQDEKLINIIKNMSEKIKKYLKGEYFYNDGDSYIQLENSNKKIPINYISSGQQEILWLLYTLLSIIAMNNNKPFIIIEEPEAHLYPKMQKEIIDFIVNFMNMTNSSILITTHSPYILTSTNNLLYAGKLKENYKNNKEKIEKINNIVGEYGAINPSEINAFKLYLNDFRYTNLINEENEINCEEIDDVSNTINETYTKLFDMELNNEQ